MNLTAIFDMDGTISDTNKLQAQVESEILSENGVAISPRDITRSYSGVKTTEFFHELLKGKNVDIDALLEDKWDRVIEAAQTKANPIPGAIEIVNMMLRAGFRVALASSSRRVYIDTVLWALGLTDKFETITSGDEVSRGKPDPEIFRLAASRMEADPINCVVFEDAAAGMAAAAAAGMKCIGLKADHIIDGSADIMVSDWGELGIEDVLKLFK